MITGTVVLDITREANDRRATGMLYGIPDGAHVVLNVGSRWVYDATTAHHLAEHADRLHFDVYGETEAVRVWVEVLRKEGAVW